MGEAEAADPALIPPAVGFDDPDYVLGRGQLDYAAEARLINDNLLDFSHLTFVHADSFGAGDSWATDRPRVTPLDRGVRVERWTIGPRGLGGDATPMDRWSSYDFLIPGVLLMTGGNFPPGTAAACHHGPPNLGRAMSGVTFTSQAVTPSGDKTARYFFSWGPRVDMGGAALRDTLMGIAAMAFEEDRVIIEAQQRVISDTPDPRVMPTGADKGITLYNRLLERLVRAEGQGALRAA